MSGREPADPGSVRLDQYLYAIRIFQTRSLAAGACRAGHVRLNGATAKAAHPVRAGDLVRVAGGDRTRELEVRSLITRRAPAAVATGCYIDRTPVGDPSARIAPPFAREPASGRPTKRDRRLLDRLRSTARATGA